MDGADDGPGDWTPDTRLEPYDEDWDQPSYLDDGVVTQLRDKLIDQQQLHAIPEFTEATFLASLRGARMNAGGDLDITLTVPISEKYRAMSLTDAIGIEIIVTAQRKRGRRFLTPDMEASDG